MELTIKQTAALDYLEDQTTNDILFGGGAGGAKSVLGCYWLTKCCLKYPGTRWVMGRAVLKTLKETTLNSFFWLCHKQGLRNKYHYVYNPQNSTIKFPPTESEILLKDLYLYPSDPEFDELGSLEITGAFIDEVNQITRKAWDITKSRIRYRLDEYGIVPKMLGTCNPAKNWVYGDFYKPFRDGWLSDEKKFVQALLSDNPFISDHYRANLLKLDENSKQRLLYGNWEYDDDPAALMSIDAIYNVFTNKPFTGEKYITVDVARFGSDTTTIIVWNGYHAYQVQRLIKKSTIWVSSAVRKEAELHNVKLSNIIADEDGVGGGVVDQLGCQGFVNNSKAVGVKSFGSNFNNLKSQCYYKLAELVNSGKISVTCDNEIRGLLVEELEQVKQHNMDKDTTKQVMPKDKVKELIGRSPDISDALMMRMYYEFVSQAERSFFAG